MSFHPGQLLDGANSTGIGHPLPDGLHVSRDEAGPLWPVTVLLSTFDGARYLPQQLDSLLHQSFPRWTVLWRDDGSGDETPSLLHAFASQCDGRVRMLREPTGHLGIAGSFLALLRRVPPDTVAAFADQDDVWLPGKLQRGSEALAAVPADIPTLYCARQILVDQSLEPLGHSPDIVRSPAFPAALTQNIATGCTVMLNPAAVALVAASHPPDGTLHDWWSYLVVGAAGGRLITDPLPVVLYRQHPSNAVGAPHSALRRGIMALRRGPREFMTLFRRHVMALVEYRHALSPRAVNDLIILHRALQHGFVARVRALRRVRGLERQTRLETLLFRLWFLIG